MNYQSPEILAFQEAVGVELPFKEWSDSLTVEVAPWRLKEPVMRLINELPIKIYIKVIGQKELEEVSELPSDPPPLVAYLHQDGVDHWIIFHRWETPNHEKKVEEYKKFLANGDPFSIGEIYGS